VRLARVSCGATLPIPGCLQDCNIVSGTRAGGGGAAREGGYNHAHARISSRARSFPRFDAHLAPSRSLVVYFHARSLSRRTERR